MPPEVTKQQRVVAYYIPIRHVLVILRMSIWWNPGKEKKNREQRQKHALIFRAARMPFLKKTECYLQLLPLEAVTYFSHKPFHMNPKISLVIHLCETLSGRNKLLWFTSLLLLSVWERWVCASPFLNLIWYHLGLVIFIYQQVIKA